MDWQKGKVIDRKYEINKVLGEGGFGITYKAKHRHLPVTRVIKTPRTKFRHDANYAGFVQRFRKEAQTLAGLKPHPHIVQVHDFFTEPDEQSPCLVMEFIEGESLYTLVQRRGALPEQEAIRYIQQIGSALSHIHKTGLVHFDATPMNIMMRRDGTPVLIDFGIAGDCPPSSISFQRGNPAFAPYEQFLGKRKVTVDIYTLAAGFYYAVTGQLPTPCSDRLDKLPLIDPKNHQAISSNLNDAIVWGMALEPQNRPQSIQKWLELPCFSESLTKTLKVNVLPPTYVPRNKGWDWSWLPWVGSPSPAPQLGDDLRSERGVDYTRLQRLLQQQRWKDADEETYRRMLEAVKREKEGWFREADLKNFPRTDLRTIDQLWVKYSKGRFGFSVQKQIWLDLGGKLGAYDYGTFKKLGDRVGWRKNGSWLNYSDYTFTTNALQGHLPADRVGLGGGLWWYWDSWVTLFSSLDSST
ncbi:serine/threonine-protein kinase [Roseofilum sp. BLCC_M154]|uniref:Serine/threonine-protein kinase n=1 Tax=Roseofilum acuticapitatum BLCC-M154 TaxID=3022444 RepID=A0ABT7AS32_9CYAN|nr:serine/threonine-protein kinase [Roseofilum acuticapitatum]MDJ1169706.1 serine/threonine-protein kinase [Roseofilum acuticapitatum BLCC-M154]